MCAIYQIHLVLFCNVHKSNFSLLLMQLGLKMFQWIIFVWFDFYYDYAPFENGSLCFLLRNALAITLEENPSFLPKCSKARHCEFLRWLVVKVKCSLHPPTSLSRDDLTLPQVLPHVSLPHDPFAVFPAILECETPLQDPGHFLELLASSQARRLDDQRVSVSHFPGLRLSTSSPPCTPPTCSTEQVLPQGTETLKPATFAGGWWGFKNPGAGGEPESVLLPSSPVPWNRCNSNTLPVQSSRGKRWASGGRWGLLRHACKMPGKLQSPVILFIYFSFALNLLKNPWMACLWFGCRLQLWNSASTLKLSFNALLAILLKCTMSVKSHFGSPSSLL